MGVAMDASRISSACRVGDSCSQTAGRRMGFGRVLGSFPIDSVGEVAIDKVGEVVGFRTVLLPDAIVPCGQNLSNRRDNGFIQYASALLVAETARFHPYRLDGAF